MRSSEQTALVYTELSDVHWNVDKFHKVSDEAHDCKANCYRLADLREFWHRRFEFL